MGVKWRRSVNDATSSCSSRRVLLKGELNPLMSTPASMSPPSFTARSRISSCSLVLCTCGRHKVDVTGVEVDVTGVEVDATGVEVDVNGAEVDVMGVEVDVMGVEVDVTGVEVDVTRVEVDVKGVEVHVTGVV
eukprot:1179491-Prorocentrum_minimum.AAC.2